MHNFPEESFSQEKIILFLEISTKGIEKYGGAGIILKTDAAVVSREKFRCVFLNLEKYLAACVLILRLLSGGFCLLNSTIFDIMKVVGGSVQVIL